METQEEFKQRWAAGHNKSFDDTNYTVLLCDCADESGVHWATVRNTRDDIDRHNREYGPGGIFSKAEPEQ